MKKEEWRDIKGYEGLYQISSWGRVKSMNYLKTGKEKIRSLNNGKDGYLLINLSKNGESKRFRVHRLVAMAFIPNPDNLPEVNHKDENKLNNCVSNLEWCTAKYNQNYGTCRKRILEKVINGKCSKTVLQCDLDGNIIAEYPSGKEVKRKLGFCNSLISMCCSGKYKYAYGYIWRYK